MLDPPSGFNDKNTQKHMMKKLKKINSDFC